MDTSGKSMIKRVINLAPSDFSTCPVWEQVANDGDRDVLLDQVWERPVRSLFMRYVGGSAIDNKGNVHWVMAWNISLNVPFVTEHMVSFSIWRGDRWILVPRYHDVLYSDESLTSLCFENGVTLPLTLCLSDMRIFPKDVLVKSVSLCEVPMCNRKPEAEILEMAVRLM